MFLVLNKIKITQQFQAQNKKNIEQHIHNLDI
jgi:hypothetical protein